MKLREIKFDSAEQCILDIEDLLLGNHRSCKWTLPQVCWHLNYPVSHSLHEPSNFEPTADQKKSQEFIDQVIVSGIPDGLPSPKMSIPPENIGLDAVDELITSLRKLERYQAKLVDEIFFGPLLVVKYRQFVLLHAAHHLSFFAPNEE